MITCIITLYDVYSNLVSNDGIESNICRTFSYKDNLSSKIVVSSIPDKIDCIDDIYLKN
jgi:hypothetical protein